MVVVVNLLIISSVFFIVCYVCAHTLLLNSIIHFTFADEKQDTYQ